METFCISSSHHLLTNMQITTQEGSFPVKLHQMLQAVSDAETTRCASWDPDGRSFVISDPKEFTNQIMGHFFNQTKYKSFQRQLNFYGFYRTCRGKIRGVCKLNFFPLHICIYLSQSHSLLLIATDSHPLFRRDNPELCNHMKRLDSRCHKEGRISSNKTLGLGSSLHQLRKEIIIDGPHLQPMNKSFSKPHFPQSQQRCKPLYSLLIPSSSSSNNMRAIGINTLALSVESSSDCDSSIGTIDMLPSMDHSMEIDESFGDDLFQYA